jgi:hypothetical protein
MARPRRSSSGSSAKFTAICRASSRVSRFGRRAVRRSDTSEIWWPSFTPSQAILPWQETQEREIG